MTSRQPQLIVTLSPEGKLVCELPGHMGTRRKVEIRESEAGATLSRILRAQEREGVEIGLDGSPTEAQVRHWERHEIWASQQCRFCIAEGRAKPDHASHRKGRKAPIFQEKRSDGVEITVKRLPEGKKADLIAKKNVGEMGL